MLAAICLMAVSSATAEPAGGRVGSGREPITAIVPVSLDPLRLALGERLFADRRLSRDSTHNCNACHDLATNGASAKTFDLSQAGVPLSRNTPTVFNAALSFRLNWAGDVRSLAAHTEGILASPVIMRWSADDAARKLGADSDVTRRFQEAYGRPPDAASLVDAIATYERSLVTPGSRFDRWLLGDDAAVTAQELTGYQLFKSLGCVSCHQGVNVGGNLFQRRGVFRPLGTPEPALVRVPSLRNVAVTAPYFHDGSAPTLAEAVRRMGVAQLGRELPDGQVSDIVAFLATLTGTYRGRELRPAVTPHAGAAAP